METYFRNRLNHSHVIVYYVTRNKKHTVPAVIGVIKLEVVSVAAPGFGVVVGRKKVSVGAK